MKRGGLLSRLFGRSKGADPFAAMGAAQRVHTGVHSSPVGVPVASAPASAVANGQPVHTGHDPAAAERAPAPAPGRSADAARVADAWGGVCDHFALQVLLLAEQLRPALDQLETDEQDTERLDRLYQIDHAVTRIRRSARDLRVLSERGDDVAGPTSSLVDTLRVAQSSIERYTQVSIGAIVDLAVVGYVSDDIASLLAALLDNATRYSPSTVSVSAHLLSEGAVMFRIEDSGIGLTGPHVAALNAVLDADVPDIDDHTSRHTGFAVVHRLARKHGVRVQLASKAAPAGASSGTTAMVTIPPGLLTEIPDPPLAMAPPAVGEPEPEPDPSATAHLTVAREPARRGPVAAVPDGPPVPAAPGEPAPEGHVPDQPAPAAPGADTPAPPAPGEPVRDGGRPPLPRRAPASLRGDEPLPGATEPRTDAPEPGTFEAAEARRSFAADLAAFSAALDAPAEPDTAEPDTAEPEADDPGHADDNGAPETSEASSTDHSHDSEEQVP